MSDPVFPQLDRLADYRDEGNFLRSRANRTFNVRRVPVDEYMAGKRVSDDEDDV